MVTEHLDNKVREFVLQLLRKGWSMQEIITALQSIKVEMASATLYEQAANEAKKQP